MKMATATEVDLSSMDFVKVARIVKVDQVPRNDACSLEKSADQWAQLLREGFEASRQGKVINPHCLTAPRRRHADPNSAALALSIANLLYPSYADSSIAQVIKYEKDIVILRKEIKKTSESRGTCAGCCQGATVLEAADP